MIRPEDEQKINQMVLNLRRSKEIACILLVLFNDELLRQDVEAELKRKLEPEGFNFRELRMTGDMYKNVPVIITREMNPQPNDIFQVFDLKKALPEVLEYLNYRREDFVEHKISVIFWLDEPTLIEIMRKALDFFAFRATPVIEFMIDRSRDMIIPGRTIPSEVFLYNSLEELDKKITLREEMLKDYLEKRPNDLLTIAGLHENLGILYHNKSNFDIAMEHFQKSLRLLKEIKDKKGEAGQLGNIGAVYQNKGELDKALDYSQQALEIQRKIGDIHGEATQMVNIAIIHRQKGELNKALEYLTKSLDIDKRIGNIQGETIALGNIGNIYLDKLELDKALEYFSQALEKAHNIGYVQGETSDLGSMGRVYTQKGDLDKALDYYTQALNIQQQIGFAYGEAITLGNIGIVYRQKGELNKALEYLAKSLDIDKRIGNIQGETIALGNIGNIYKQMGELNKALDYTKKALNVLIFYGMVIYADLVYRNMQEIISQMKSRGIEISQEDAKEITELTEQYEKLKGTVSNTVS